MEYYMNIRLWMLIHFTAILLRRITKSRKWVEKKVQVSQGTMTQTYGNIHQLQVVYKKSIYKCVFVYGFFHAKFLN